MSTMSNCSSLLGLPFVANVLIGTIPAVAAPDAFIPDLSGMWGRNMFNFTKPEFGPGPVEGLKRLSSGAADPSDPVGDYHNPMLKPEAAEAV